MKYEVHPWDRIAAIADSKLQTNKQTNKQCFGITQTFSTRIIYLPSVQWHWSASHKNHTDHHVHPKETYKQHNSFSN